MRSQHPRRAFTLVEMLVAIAIIVLLMGIVLAFMPKREVRLAAQGADQLQTYIASAKSRAMRDGAPRGIRLIKSSQGGFREFQYIEVPAPYAPENVTLTVGINSSTATLTGDHRTSIAQGDLLEITHGLPSIHRISQPPVLVGTNTRLILVNSPPAASNAPLTLTNNYRIIRQPRPLMGENTLVLPDKVYVAFDQTDAAADPYGKNSANIPQSYTGANWEILFSPSGQVINARGGRIILWLADDNNVSKPTLLTVYSFTGAVGAHPEAPGADPYAFTRDGRSSGQ